MDLRFLEKSNESFCDTAVVVQRAVEFRMLDESLVEFIRILSGRNLRVEPHTPFSSEAMQIGKTKVLQRNCPLLRGWEIRSWLRSLGRNS